MVSARCRRHWEIRSQAEPIEAALGSTQFVHDVLSAGFTSQFLWNEKKKKEKEKNTWPGDVAQLVEFLPNRYKTLGSLSPCKTKYGGTCP